MAGPTKSMLPDCGLYRTTKPLAGHEEQFPAGLLVYFHNHSDSGLPQVLAPDHNVHNRWHFHGPGVEFRGLSGPTVWSKCRSKASTRFAASSISTAAPGPRVHWFSSGIRAMPTPSFSSAQVRNKLDENDLWFSDRGVGHPERAALHPREHVVFQEPTGRNTRRARAVERALKSGRD